jgi:hypothetical protein
MPTKNQCRNLIHCHRVSTHLQLINIIIIIIIIIIIRLIQQSW